MKKNKKLTLNKTTIQKINEQVVNGGLGWSGLISFCYCITDKGGATCAR